MTIFSRWFLVAGVMMAGSLNLQAGQMKYEVAGPSSIREFDLEEHFRPSNVYHFAPGSDRDLLDSNGQVVPIPYDPHSPWTSPQAWNQAGEIVGKSYFGANENVGFLYKNGEMTYFEPKIGIISQGAYAINNYGEAVGGAYPMGGNAYVYANGVKTNLGGLEGRIWNTAHDINDAGVIIGNSFNNAGDHRAFVVLNGTMYDLTQVTSGLDQGFTIDNALAITSDGWILAQARDYRKFNPNGINSWSDFPAKDLWLKPLAGETSTVIDTTPGGFWTTPTNTDGLNDPATTGGGSGSTPQPVPVPEPTTYLIWGSLALLLVWKRLA